MPIYLPTAAYLYLLVVTEIGGATSYDLVYGASPCIKVVPFTDFELLTFELMVANG